MSDTAPPIVAPRHEGRLRLADGRRIGFAEYGAARGPLVLWFHGTPGGRGQIPPAARVLAADRGVRLVALERPGIGLSTPHLYDRVTGWARDVGEIADLLGADTFRCVGLSGGGPYVLACASVHPERMERGLVLGGVAPARGDDAVAGGLVGFASRFAPLIEAARAPIGHALWAGVRGVTPLKDAAFDLYVRFSPEGDQRVFRRPEMRAMFIDDLIRASRRQVHAPVADVVLFLRDWGFRLGELTVPIDFWHGDADNIVPLAHAEHMATLVPGATLRVRPGESHLGALDAAEEIFDTLGA